MNPLFFYPGMLFLGVGVGLMSGALGLGGGILMVPAFLEFVPVMDPHTAKGTSLLIIAWPRPTWRLSEGHVDWHGASPFSSPSAPSPEAISANWVAVL